MMCSYLHRLPPPPLGGPALPRPRMPLPLPRPLPRFAKPSNSQKMRAIDKKQKFETNYL